jgi:hypothetical protein
MTFRSGREHLRATFAALAVCFSSVCFGQTGTHDARVDFLIALAQRESAGDKSSVNPFGYLGLFQMGGRALVDANFYFLGPSGEENAWDGTFTLRASFVDVDSRETYLQSAGAQELAVRSYHDVQWSRIVRLHLDSRVGSFVGGVNLSKSGMIAGAHLVGVGALLRFVRTNGADIVRDGNGVPITEYLRIFGRYY